jgi:tetratricopeptide (TPR) repeat protein
LFNRRSGSDILQAKSHFEEATRLDPGYGRAWAGLAGVYLVARYENVELPEAMQKWGEAAERGVALAPDLPEAHIRLSQYYMHVEKWDAARAEQARAIALDPEDPLVLGVRLSDAIYTGRLEAAIEVQQRIIAIDPLAANHRGNLGQLLTMVGRLPDAQAQLERALELSPASAGSMVGIADVLILEKRTDEALKVIARMPDGYLRDERFALAHFARGDTREGNAMLERLRAASEKPDADPGVIVAIAEIYAATNDPDRAFEWLDKARPRSKRQLELMPSWMLRENLQVTVYFKPLHADPRWGELLKELDL